MSVPLRQQLSVGRYLITQKLKGVKRYPLVLMLEPLFRCNLECAGCGKIDYPDEIKTDGVSILPDLKGGQGEKHEYLYWDYGHVRNTFKQALRYGKYKALSITRDGEVLFELYDLEKDPGETRNIAGDYLDLVEEMKQMMREAYVYSDDYPRKAEHFK